jgi:hypothetical protein
MANLQTLKTFGRLRAINIAVCIAAILYFLIAFVAMTLLNARVDASELVWIYVTAILILVPQVLVLLVLLSLEMAIPGGRIRHAIVFALIVATIGIGALYTAGVTDAVPLP